MSYFSDIIFIVLTGLYYIGGLLLSLWWIWIPWFLFVLARDLWFKYIRNMNLQNLEWVLLEIVPPRDIQKTARAMEQFFASLHGLQGGTNWEDRNIKGLLPDYFSLEIISQEGEIHFLIRTQAKHRDLVESNIYAQYPESEISQVNDYVDSFPIDIPNQDYDSWGAEFNLIKEDAYPIRTYPDFEKDVSADEQRIDPIASLLEIMSKMGVGEQIWIQTLIRPVNDDWKKEGEKLRDKLVGRKEEKEQGLLKEEAVAWKDAGIEVANRAITGQISESNNKEEKKLDSPFLWTTTKSEQEIIHAIETNIAKIGYEVIIRYVYLARKDIYRASSVKKWIYGAYKQFNTQDLNGFIRNNKVEPGIDYKIQLKELRDLYRKKNVFADYGKRKFVQYSSVIDYLKPLIFERMPIINWFFVRSKPFIFNTEELATIYHFPVITVKSPLTPKVEARKGEPPIGLPIE